MAMRAPRELGYRGRQVLAFVRDCIDSEGHAPSYTTIRDTLGFNDRAEVCRVVARLEGRGLVARAKPVGKIDRLLLETFLDLQLVEGFVYLDDLHAEAVSRLPKPANRDTRRQVVVRALKRGNLLRAKGGELYR